MTKLMWDQTGERRYETGVDHGVLYLRDQDGDYTEGYAWNGLTTVTESPSGAESSPQYADNLKYLDLQSAEEFGATIEAFTYPDEFGACDGTASPEEGIYVGQQPRRSFGFCYRTLVGNDLVGNDYGYKLHLVYGCKAAPSEKANATVNDSPEATTFSWELTTTPTEVGTIGGKEYKPTATLTLDSTKVDSGALSDLEEILYGATGVDPRMPLPAEVIGLFASTVTDVRLTAANAPTYNGTTHVVTLPAVTGVRWEVNGVTKSAGAQPALTTGQTAVVTAHATSGYRVTGDDDWTFDY
jgi:hypothetical protein